MVICSGTEVLEATSGTSILCRTEAPGAADRIAICRGMYAPGTGVGMAIRCGIKPLVATGGTAIRLEVGTGRVTITQVETSAVAERMAIERCTAMPNGGTV